MKENSIKKHKSRWIFLVLVIILYLILALVNFSLVKESFLTFLNLLKKIFPIFFVVLFFMFISGLFFNAKKITKSLGKDAGIKGWLISIIGGILSDGPLYMWYPLLLELREHGMRDAFIVAFFYNRAVKISLLPMMIYYFGLSFVIVLTFYMILFSIINGVLVEKFLKVRHKD